MSNLKLTILVCLSAIIEINDLSNKWTVQGLETGNMSSIFFTSFAASTNQFDIFRQCTCIVFILQLLNSNKRTILFLKLLNRSNISAVLKNVDEHIFKDTSQLVFEFNISARSYCSVGITGENSMLL